jgi:hypothetical protein
MNLQTLPTSASTKGHSSTVEMNLYRGSESYPVLQSSKSVIKVRDPAAISPGDAIMEIIVDGRVHRRDVRVIGPSAEKNWLDITDR